MVNPSSGVPVFRQIADQVKRAAAAGRLTPGRALASVRSLARQLKINPMTVAKAYATLAAEGVVVARRGRGVFLARPGRQLTAGARRQRLAPLLDQVVAEAHQLGLPPEEALSLLRERFEELAEAESTAKTKLTTERELAIRPRRTPRRDRSARSNRAVPSKPPEQSVESPPAPTVPPRPPSPPPAPPAPEPEEDVSLL